MASLPQSMRASQCSDQTRGIDKDIRYTTDASLPAEAASLPSNSALVKVAYASPNPVDYKLPESSIYSTLNIKQRPFIPCGDFGGTIVSTNLPNLNPGDRVFGRSDPPLFGSLAEYLVVRGVENVVKLPDAVSFQDGATLGVAGLTAYQCLAPNVRSGNKVLINGGSGGTGTFAIQIAKALGCYVTTTCSSANVELCKQLGADEVIDYRNTDVTAHITRQGTQYDLLVDCAGTPAIFWKSSAYLKPGGRYITIAATLTWAFWSEMWKMMYLPTLLGGVPRKAEFLRRVTKAEDYAKLAQWIAEGKLKPVISKTYDLEDAKAAFVELKSGRTRGKIVVKIEK
ncbi:Zinc-type alcohol dehydrogenase-like protein [Cercospora beticola]|uniref:Zinc-type alcohol dehydrogenase-like protein n=1 Tax=Cercospora beticola TaxID=122368 RepID=A0A2G5HPD4_CERBT|nr:Zinc-type alcohol dehydrogenase-like protein [Cercospora beticola]PIA94406.1 Zinc-type alcohol dehydrogenase-like protein [Cercospora beticola]WPB04866.1 hypothetical protein RHO25_009513 [Cercospora beticola]